jgi:hypothetical protein
MVPELIQTIIININIKTITWICEQSQLLKCHVQPILKITQTTSNVQHNIHILHVLLKTFECSKFIFFYKNCEITVNNCILANAVQFVDWLLQLPLLTQINIWLSKRSVHVQSCTPGKLYFFHIHRWSTYATNRLRMKWHPCHINTLEKIYWYKISLN